MEPKKNNEELPAVKLPVDNQHTQEAYKQAEKDIDADAELSAHNDNDDLDEGELARLGEDDNGVI